MCTVKGGLWRKRPYSSNISCLRQSPWLVQTGHEQLLQPTLASSSHSPAPACTVLGLQVCAITTSNICLSDQHGLFWIVSKHLFLFVWHKVSLCSPDWPRTQGHLPVSASGLVGLQACTIMLSSPNCNLTHNLKGNAGASERSTWHTRSPKKDDL